MTKIVTVGVLLVALLSGCAITQQVKPVTGISDKTICVVENPAVRSGFLEAYKRSLGARGFTVKQLPSSAAATACPLTSTYSANWRWDLALYMAYAELRIYSNGKPVGEAKYDSLSGSGNMNKFIEADKKIDELVSLLFPAGSEGTGIGMVSPPKPSAVASPATKPETPSIPSAAPAIAGAATGASPRRGGQESFQIEQMGRQKECDPNARAWLTAKDTAMELYTYQCRAEETWSLRCEFGQCRILQ